MTAFVLLVRFKLFSCSFTSLMVLVGPETEDDL